MGSGLILFVIVGAWLAVLVPMGLRSHDDAAPSRSVERFSDAMRVLSRRAGGPAEAGDLPGADDAADGTDAHEWAPSAGLRGSALRVLDAAAGARAALTDRLPRRLPSLPHRRRPTAPAAPARGPRSTTRSAPRSTTRSTAAARRRRVLLTLGALAVLGLVAALVVPAALLVTVTSGLLAAAFGWHCRSRSRARAAWLRNRAAVEAELSRRPVAEPAGPARVPAQERRTRTAPAVQLFDAAAPEPAPADQLFDLSAYEAPLTVPPAGVAPAARAAAAPAARAAVRAALGAEWQPVPVPLPTYVGKAAAPARSARPSAQREQRQAHDAVLDDPGEQRPEVVERGRAAAGW